MPRVSVCVAVYRAHDAPNVRSLGDDLPAALDGLDGELVVTLNGIGASAAHVPGGARTVPLAHNEGVAPGWNAAARAAEGEVLVFANDDMVLGPQSLRLLAEALEDDTRGVVGPVGTRWDIPAGTHREWVDLTGLGPGAAVECEIVSGHLFATRRGTYEALGGFDDFYAPCTWEEIDFCTAARAAGLRNYAIAGVAHEHEFGISRRQPPWRRIRYAGRSETLRSIHRRNRRHFLGKWAAAALPPVR